MEKVIKFLAYFLLVSFIGCSSISTSTDFDPSVDFTKYKTYKWFDAEMPDHDALTKHPLVKRRIEQSVEKALDAKGYKKGTEDNFDFVVIIHAGTKEKIQVNTYNYNGYGYGGYGYGGYGSGWGGYGRMSTTDVNYYNEATLVIDIADAEKEELVWRGTATGVVSKSEKTPAEAQEDADEVVNLIMANFPPEKEK
ncbi:MAG: DUF4136 domain-containing protein [Melioribacteraceae bacterium]|nr:DUF4136 domain-containing protein [Melioribacteraceae bacterium]